MAGVGGVTDKATTRTTYAKATTTSIHKDKDENSPIWTRDVNNAHAYIHTHANTNSKHTNTHTNKRVLGKHSNSPLYYTLFEMQ